ncbi:hypothetical protein GCM10007108_02660 [Thermogymnomonas acidicola]|uniref:Uncharacterized protein n=3 Tax=Thermogymnomonas acidicola TaxID=399579 RepID=A0AA37F8T1_9ARCH|nr:hypothetical protein GCM10007108_02660 [Thermogymnomonas acidicola]
MDLSGLSSMSDAEQEALLQELKRRKASLEDEVRRLQADLERIREAQRRLRDALRLEQG